MHRTQETGKISVTDYVRVTSTEWYYTSVTRLSYQNALFNYQKTMIQITRPFSAPRSSTYSLGKEQSWKDLTQISSSWTLKGALWWVLTHTIRGPTQMCTRAGKERLVLVCTHETTVFSMELGCNLWVYHVLMFVSCREWLKSQSQGAEWYGRTVFWTSRPVPEDTSRCHLSATSLMALRNPMLPTELPSEPLYSVIKLLLNYEGRWRHSPAVAPHLVQEPVAPRWTPFVPCEYRPLYSNLDSG